MSKYHEVVYGNYPKSEFPKTLVEELLDRHWPISSKYKNYREFLISSSAQKTMALDVGCGDCSYLKKGFWAFHFASGVDANIVYNRCMVGGKIEESESYFVNPLDFNKDVLPFLDNTYDIVFSKSTIEHVANTDHFLSELYRVLKPGGILMILTPAWEYNYKDFYNDYTHVKPFHRKGLQDALKINGFSGVNVEYLYYLPWLWRRPYLLPLVKFAALFYRLKWQDKEETKHRVNIRFSQEIQLLAIAGKLQKKVEAPLCMQGNVCFMNPYLYKCGG